MLSEISQSQNDKYCMILLISYRYLKHPKSLKQKVEWWLSRAERGRNGELMVSGCGVSVLHNEKCFRDVLPTLCIYLTIPYTLKRLRQWIISFSNCKNNIYILAKRYPTVWKKYTCFTDWKCDLLIGQIILEYRSCHTNIPEGSVVFKSIKFV